MQIIFNPLAPDMEVILQVHFKLILLIDISTTTSEFVFRWVPQNPADDNSTVI